MKGDGQIALVRISREADDKLKNIAKTKSLTKLEALSRIVLFYYSNRLDMDFSYPDDLKSIIRELTIINSKTTKLIGSSERTESFIKSLVREDRRSDAGSFPIDLQEINDSKVSDQPSNDQLPRALGLLDRFFSNASKTIDFEGREAMQIRISQVEFGRLKREYEELCTSQSI